MGWEQKWASGVGDGTMEGQGRAGQGEGEGNEGEGERKEDGVTLGAGVVVRPLVTACLGLAALPALSCLACLLTFGSPPMADVLSRASRRRRAILSCRAWSATAPAVPAPGPWPGTGPAAASAATACL